MERLNKFLSEAGIASRRKADELIAAGEIKVNGDVVRDLGVKIDEENDVIEFIGKRVLKTNDFVYYILNKPKGVVSSANDENGAKTVVDLVPRSPRVYPVGRLDKDTVGLILLTNDGELTKELTHPSFEHQKEYEVAGIIESRIRNHESWDEQEFKKTVEKKFLRGIKIDNKLMKADSVEVLPAILNTKYLILRIVLHTGYNRQVRKMCDKIGLEVTRLTRIGLAKLKLADLNLAPGDYKIITKADIL
jgi:pseudouridine synthase